VKVFCGLEELRPGLVEEPVSTVGVFDGVHRGHRQLLYELGVWARAVPGTPAVITFERPPIEATKGIRVPLLLSLEHRLLVLERHGVEACVVLDFEAVRELEAGEFLREVLVGRLGGTRLLLGFDSRVGRGGAGDARRLPEIGRALGVEVRIGSRVLDRDGGKIGSSAIREAIARGDLERAANLLGRPVSVMGRVVRGSGRGRGLGAATANLEVADRALPPDGVYLVRVFRGSTTAPGLANLGKRPTFEAGGERLLEVHVPGWSEEMYGEHLEVRLVRRLREERRFADGAALRERIESDLEALAQAVARGEI